MLRYDPGKHMPKTINLILHSLIFVYTFHNVDTEDVELDGELQTGEHGIKQNDIICMCNFCVFCLNTFMVIKL